MKLSSLILLSTVSLMIAGMVATNFLLKKEYDRIDRKDIYWNYGKITKRPFKHLKIEGGNETLMVFEKSDSSSVSVFKNWEGYDNKVVTANVNDDTLFIQFNLTTTDLREREYIKRLTLVRISAPELLSVSGRNTSLSLHNFDQDYLTTRLSGKSYLEVQSSNMNFNRIDITQQDSAEVVFKLLPGTGSRAQARSSSDKGISPGQSTASLLTTSSLLNDRFHVKTLNASLAGSSTLNIGNATIDSLKLDISPASSVVLSGQSVKLLQR